MSVLEPLLRPTTLETFERDVLFKEPYAAADTAIEYRRLIGWPLLFEIFATNHPDCWLAKRGKLLENPTGKVSPAEAITNFEEKGYSVVVRHAEQAHPKLKEIAAKFHDHFQDPVDIQLYATPAKEEGFDWHYDLEEVFVIQSIGEKEFFLRVPKASPRLDRVELPRVIDFQKDFGPEIRCHLKAGDFLYIPAGVYHKARAITPSFHMSVGVMSSARRHKISQANVAAISATK